jgi:hypothetical protein
MVTYMRVVAISPDALGVAGRRMKNIKTAPGRGGRPLAQLWGRPLSWKWVVIMLLNRQEVAADITMTLEEAGFGGSAAAVHDTWTGATTVAKGQTTAKNVPPHSAFLAVLSQSSFAAFVDFESASGSGSSGSTLTKKMKHETRRRCCARAQRTIEGPRASYAVGALGRGGCFRRIRTTTPTAIGPPVGTGRSVRASL